MSGTESSKIYNQEAAQNLNFSSVHIFSEIMKSNIGPYGALKLLEPETGDLHITKDGGTLLKSLTILNPTALVIVRAALAQEKEYHDGTSSIVTLIDSIILQSEYQMMDNVHPRRIVKGLEEARGECLKYINQISLPLDTSRQFLRDIVSSASKTKINQDISDTIVDAVMCIKEEGSSVDLDRAEILRIKQSSAIVKLVKGVVIDQGFRNEQMAKNITKCRILAINVSLELEHSAVSTFAPVANADQKEKFKIAERRFVDDKVRSIISLKDTVGGGFLVVNGKGIDGPALEILSRAGISALRRVSGKVMNRLIHACGCRIVNCVDDLSLDVLGYAGVVREETYKKDKYIFIDDVKNPKAVTLIIGGTNDLGMSLTEEAVKDGLRSLKNAFDDGKVLPGGGATEIALAHKLLEYKRRADPQYRIGIEVFANSLLELPRTLCKNSGYDHATLVPEMQGQYEDNEIAGLDVESGIVVNTGEFGIYDNYCVKKGIFQNAPIVASQLLLVDQIIESAKEKKKPNKDDK